MGKYACAGGACGTRAASCHVTGEAAMTEVPQVQVPRVRLSREKRA